MKFLKIIITIVFLSCLSNSIAQVGIGTITPESSSALDVTATDKGFIAPRVSLTDVTDSTAPIDTPVEGLLVYNTNSSVTGGSGTGYYYWNGTQWSKLITATTVDDWKLEGNSGTNPATDFIGTTDAQDLVIRTNDTEKIRVESGGDVGVGITDPEHTLDVQGDFRVRGDFINQQLIGTHSSTTQSIPFTNLAFTPLTGTTNSITIPDGNGVANSGVFITGFARVFGGNLNGSNSSLGGYFMVLERDTDPTFSSAIILTYTSGTCYIETPNGGSSSSIAYGGGGHISYLDSNLTAGVTYYYRLTFVPNSQGINSGNFEVYQRDLIVVQIKR
ncbi:hypothetical protein [Patiriisocius hiemis]|uniref:Uncharacterized protein n=1 Tax=Patiriisocius hiemis TaxID=3075604 RepID=A0ABU2YD51_9FLAO|nr:hypothetical protein [Constantimarinum sp. W242]MDT0555599.1 hypothetical protein [Constantimarinum sp. W242]